MLTQSVSLAWQLYNQERHTPSYRYLSWVYIILMVFLVTLSQSSNSIQQYLTANLATLLGADAVISQSQPLSAPQLAQLGQYSSDIVETQSLKTTLTHQQHWQRVLLKAVGDGYPLQGQLKATTLLGGDEQVMTTGPAPGEIWLDPRLMASLSVTPGDSLTLAGYAFQVSHILAHEPDRLMEGHNVDMRAMINLTDMAKLEFAKDLITHRYLLAVAPSQTAPLLEWQETELPAAQMVYKQGSHPLALFWQRVENVIGLASIVLFFMAAIAIEQLSEVQVRKEQYFAAVCMSIGAGTAQGLSLSIWKWMLRFVFLLPWVIVAAAICHFLIVGKLATTFMGLSWHWDWWVALKWIGATALIFLLVQLPVWWSLKQTSIRQLLQQPQGAPATRLIKAASLIMLAAVAFIYSDNGLLTAMVLSAILVCIVMMILTSWLTLTCGEKLTQNVSGLLPFCLYMMKQRLISKSTQILGVGLCAFLLLFTLTLMKDLGQTMSAYQRQHDGNLLISQASLTQMQGIKEWAAKHEISIRHAKPFYYAKLIAINDTSLKNYSDKPSDTMATFQRAIRLHWTDTVPANNQVQAGNWWKSDTTNWQQISVEQEVMTDLGLALGDRMTFFINNQPFTFSIVATHAYKPGAGSITFWVQMPTLAQPYIDAPQYYMGSLELSAQHFPLINALWQQYPTLRMVSLKELTQRFDSTLAMVTQVITGFSILIILLSIIVTVSSIQSLEVKEKKKNSIILSFGFTRRTTLQLNMLEWLVTGLIAALGAIVSTCFAGWMIYQSQFSLAYQPNWIWLLTSILVILTSAIGIGVWASKQSLSSSIRELLAE